MCDVGMFIAQHSAFHIGKFNKYMTMNESTHVSEFAFFEFLLSAFKSFGFYFYFGHMSWIIT